MSRSPFGWSLPPGVSMRDIDPPEGPCEVCKKPVDDCVCPECPVCKANGDPKCYYPAVVRNRAWLLSDTHQMKLNRAQRLSRAEAAIAEHKETIMEIEQEIRELNSLTDAEIADLLHT